MLLEPYIHLERFTFLFYHSKWGYMVNLDISVLIRTIYPSMFPDYYPIKYCDRLLIRDWYLPIFTKLLSFCLNPVSPRIQ